MTDFSVESWNEARTIAAIAQLTPNAFSTCVRYLRKDMISNGGQLSRIARYCLRTVIRSSSARTALYYATLTFRPDRLNQNADFNIDQLATIYTLDDIAHLIAMHFIFRRVKKGCDAEGFKALLPNMLNYGEIGGHIGASMPSVGLGAGLTVGMMRFLATAMFLGIDPKGFEKYRRVLKSNAVLFDLAAETSLWGCNHLQIAAMMMQLIGLGVEESNSFAQAFQPSIKTDEELATETYRFKITWIWMESLLKTGLPPEMRHKGQFYPRSQDLELMVKRVQQLREKDSLDSWILKSKQDASPESTPGLFVTPDLKSGVYRAEDSIVELENLSEADLKVDEE